MDPNPGELSEPYLASILEIFVHCEDLADAYDTYRRLREMRYVANGQSVDFDVTADHCQTLVLAGKRVAICREGVAHRAFQLLNYLNINSLHASSDLARTLHEWALEGPGIVDMTERSRRTLGVVQSLAVQHGTVGRPYLALSFSSFSDVAERLQNMGLLTVPIGAIDLGDFRKNVPFCREYGFTRGTPVDRYYLTQFVDSVRHDVVGKTLEIGGQKENRTRYGFTNVTDYWIMDIDERSGADTVADAHDPLAWPEDSLDSVILFNVLEHCERPWIIAANVHRWLQKGGKVFCVVPNMQRMHSGPKDFWRILPDALGSMFETYRITKQGSYGNLLTSIAALSGLAAEELPENALACSSPEYPVMTWLIAQKT
jgi:hypothetical protein